ncbi:MAG: DUF4329 domain-containing protein [Elusimicrobiota bacterium]|nr:DUF4329 domain-containing protein [Elusimicrobiota bacterium]
MRPFLAALALAFAAPAAAQPRDYASADAAAAGFVDHVRAFPEQRNEYCAWIERVAGGRFVFGAIGTGDFNACKASFPKPSGAVASVHTHPIWGPAAADVGASGQVFSEGDFGFAERDDVRLPVYLGAPAGHILRYEPGGTVCSSLFITRHFRVTRDLSPTVRGRLEVAPGAKTALFDRAGRPLPKPAYCVAAPVRP